MTRARSALLCVAVAVMAALLAACGGGSDSTSHTIVATTTVLGDVARSLAGDDARVEVLIPTGADPHDYQPSSRQVAELASADLVIANGLGLEEGFEDALVAAESDGVRVLRVGPLVDPLPLGSGTGDDPHVWLDPLRMAEAARLIGAALDDVEPAIDWVARADAYAERLVAAHREIEQILSAIPPDDRKLVTNHDSLGYLADRYGLTVVGTVVPGGSTLGDPSSADLAALVETIRREQVTAIFTETTEPATLAETVAAEVGFDVAVVELNTGSLGAEGSGAETLIEMLRSNAVAIADALG